MIMQDYKVIARKYRPQKFQDVLGQDPIVATLKNCIRLNRVPHAFLFSGSRGTGKTTLARLLAKALNCGNRSSDFEPCNQCSSCKEIDSGSSLNVLEVDGASHRGIDDIRRITETVGYSINQGSCKVYIIDEVHMLTKEAFNALLKTLEEPPLNTKFIFATTEPHKIPKTILSRCQHFHLNRIPTTSIVSKLRAIVSDNQRDVTDGALACLAALAEGGLRDAESLLDQTLSFREGQVDEKVLQELFGWMDKEILFSLDKAGKAGDFKVAFEVADQLFSTGKDLSQFLDDLISHFRILTKMHLGIPHPDSKYKESASLYNKEQLMELFEILVKAPDEMRYHPTPRIALEALLLRILRSHFQIPIDFLVQKLTELESGQVAQTVKAPPAPVQAIAVPKPPTPKPTPIQEAPPKSFGQKEETLIQFAAVELEGTLKRS
jgi:DNA polymerase III, subunit gamma and tau